MTYLIKHLPIQNHRRLFPDLTMLNGKEETFLLVISRYIAKCYFFSKCDWTYLKEDQSETGALPLEAKLKDKQGVETSISLFM